MNYLFKKYQRELLAFCNTSFGRSYIGHSGKEAYDPFPIVWVGRSGFTQLLRFEKNKPVLRYTTYPGTRKLGEIHDNLFGTILAKLEIANKYRIKDPKDLPFVIPHFMGETLRLQNKLPQIFFATLTANPQAGGGGGNVTCDGGIEQNYAGGSGVSWATIRGAAGNYANTTTLTGNGYMPVYFQCDTVLNQYIYLDRGGFTFDTSSLGSGATGVSGTFSIYGINKQDAAGDTPDVNIYGFTPANANNLVAGDYAQTGATAYCTTAITYANYSTVAFNDFALNATGISAISLTGVTKISTRNANYDVANSAPSWFVVKDAGLGNYFADSGSNIPKLVVTYTPAPSSHFLSLMGVGT